jgi:hypothetical protein
LSDHATDTVFPLSVADEGSANHEAAMKTPVSLLIPMFAVLNAQAESIEKAIIAAMSLSEEKSYSWHSSVRDDAQSYEIEGKTYNGYTWQRQPMPKSIAKRLGRGTGDLLEAIFKDTHRYVIATEDGWKKLGELPKQHDDWQEGYWIYVTTPGMRTADMPADELQSEPFGLPPAIYVPVVADDDDRQRVYSNAQFALSLPHEQLGIIVSSHTSLDASESEAAGNLSDIGAQLLLVYDGHEYIKPVIATGRFKLWYSGGTVAKYLVELAGIVIVDRKPVYVRQKSTTVLKDVGTTRFDLPIDAHRRLASN